MLFEGRYKTQDYFRYFLHLFSTPSFIFFEKWKLKLREPILTNSLFGYFKLFIISIQRIVCFLFVYKYILKLKANKLFENSDADLSWLLFERSQLVCRIFLLYPVNSNFVHPTKGPWSTPIPTLHRDHI